MAIAVIKISMAVRTAKKLNFNFNVTQNNPADLSIGQRPFTS